MAVSAAETTAEQLRAEALAWLRANLPDGWIEAIDAGDDARLHELRTALHVDDWLVRLGESGYATPTWPAEYGAGLSLSPLQARQVGEVIDRYRVPRPWNILGIGMGGPTVIEWGTEEQKHRYLRGIATNRDIWCQLFSEPGAGSDVAGLSTSAARDGDEWVVNGQKVWTTLGHVAKYGMLVARTDPAQPKHRGLSYFIVDMHGPGVDVRPLVQITGDAEFNEVFFTDARVPDSARIGPVGEGWRVALTTLMNERVSLSGAGSAGGEAVGGNSVARLIERHRPVVDLRIRQRLAQAWIDGRLIRLNNQRAADKRRSGGEVGPEGSITKLQQAMYNQRLQKLAVDLEGAYGTAWEGMGLERTRRSQTFDPAAGDDHLDIARGFLRAQANTIEGGTSDIMRNILGERVLGLPKEPDVSRDLPWKDVPR
jgi:alkylation response protein AidB-like acyl-CoA dehydrogenase